MNPNQPQMFNGMKVISNPLCTVEEPVRKHIMKGSQRQTYHDRIQKKWNKRFGMKRVPGMYIIDPSVVGVRTLWPKTRGEKCIVAHPDIIERMKNLPPVKVDKQKLKKAYSQLNTSANNSAENFKRFGEAMNRVGILNPRGLINTNLYP